MASRQRSKNEERSTRPSTTVENDEAQMIAHTVELVRQQLLDGTASSQVMTHYLKLGSTRSQLEHERLRQENELLKAKIDALASAKNVEELYSSALNAMRSYSGHEEDYDEEYEDEYYD